jgi:hypothetical protein
VVVSIGPRRLAASGFVNAFGSHRSGRFELFKGSAHADERSTVDALLEAGAARARKVVHRVVEHDALASGTPIMDTALHGYG